jgi:diaminopimelate epimerase
MKMQFSKMHGLGNDFVVVNSVTQKINLSSKQIQRLSDRHRGVGFDQLLLIEESNDAAYDFSYRIFNADGGEVEQCGNGARCAAKYIHQYGLSDKTTLQLKTVNGAITLINKPNGLVAVNMGKAIFEPQAIPFIADNVAQTYQLNVAEQSVEVFVVSVGNPHAVMLVNNTATAPVATLGAALEMHERFPKRVNVGFMQVLNREHIKLRVYERGAGETQACGSGACAAVIAGRCLNLLDENVTVSLSGGDLTISWLGNSTDDIWMTGTADMVFEGEIEVY